MTPRGFIQLSLSMRFIRYPKGEAYQITSRKLAAGRRAVQREKDRYPLFPELVKHQAAEDRLASIAVERETWWQEMRERQAQPSAPLPKIKLTGSRALNPPKAVRRLPA